MQYLISFLEGITTFISPCLLPMLPVYLGFFAGSRSKKPWLASLMFIAGFSLVFMAMGAFAGAIGSFLVQHRVAVDIVSGIIVIILGLSFLGLFSLPFFNAGRATLRHDASLVQSFIFGMVFSISWTPCVGAFLGSALMLAGSSATMLQGLILLLCYCLGLGLPFLLSSILIDTLEGAFKFLKTHYKAVNAISGAFLILVSLLMATGLMSKLLGSLS